MKRLLSILALALGACTAPQPVPVAPQATVLEVQIGVKSVHDGDTLTLADGRKIRLWGVDAPELKQPDGPEARDWLQKRLSSGGWTVVVKAQDRYQRSVAELKTATGSINEELVAAGHAWWYREYAKKAENLRIAEESARHAKRGLWIQPDAQAPWNFRKKEK